MTGKVTFDTEVDALRKAMDAAKTKAQDASGAAESVGAAARKAASGLEAAAEEKLDWALEKLDGTDLDRLVKEFTSELESMQKEKPVMTLFGAFLLGYLLGRSK